METLIDLSFRNLEKLDQSLQLTKYVLLFS